MDAKKWYMLFNMHYSNGEKKYFANVRYFTMSMNTVIENGYKGLSRDTNRSSGRMLTFYTLDTSLEEVEVQNDDDIAIIKSEMINKIIIRPKYYFVSLLMGRGG